MSRELKFRAWDESNKIMHFDVEFIRSGTEGNDWIIFKSDKQTLNDKNVLDNPYFQKQIKLMQYTGLKDKNGKEIYECDLLKVKYNSECEDIVEVYCGYDGFKVKGTSCENKDLGYSTYLGNVIHEAEAVGNIYENPELLKRKVNK